jgi:hypothetical protein
MEEEIKIFHQTIQTIYNCRKKESIKTCYFNNWDYDYGKLTDFVKRLKNTDDYIVNFYLQYEDFYKNHPWGRIAVIQSYKNELKKGK